MSGVAAPRRLMRRKVRDAAEWTLCRRCGYRIYRAHLGQRGWDVWRHDPSGEQACNWWENP